jgi:phosphoheptose isomerase
VPEERQKSSNTKTNVAVQENEMASDPNDATRTIFIEAAAAHHGFASSGLKDVIEAASAISSALSSGRKVLAFGNGGSASDAEHLVAELVGRFEGERRSLAAIALTADSSVVTAIANDYGYEQVFTRQVEGLGTAGDVAFGISTSGRSKNVEAALAAAESTRNRDNRAHWTRRRADGCGCRHSFERSRTVNRSHPRGASNDPARDLLDRRAQSQLGLISTHHDRLRGRCNHRFLSAASSRARRPIALRVGRTTNIVTEPAASPTGTQTSNCFNGRGTSEEAEAQPGDTNHRKKHRLI